LAWHRRRVVVLDRVSGPLFFTLEKLWNVPGFSGASGAEIQKRLKAQALELGATFERANIVRAGGQIERFHLEAEDGRTWDARRLLLATGVARFHPTVDGDFRPCFAYAGKGNLYYCPDCEAPELFGKDTVVIAVGTADDAVAMAIGLTRYASRVRVLLAPGEQPRESLRAARDRRGVEVVHGTLAALDGERRVLHRLLLADGSRIEAEAFFVSTPARGRTDLAEQLGVSLAPGGGHAAVASQRGDTNIPGVWIAGDLRPMTQQVAVALGTGNLAAVMIDQSLRKADVASTLSPIEPQDAPLADEPIASGSFPAERPSDPEVEADVRRIVEAGEVLGET
jgi:thioredoxin reductase